MTSYAFDDRNIQWHKLGDFKYIVYSVLDIDKDNLDSHNKCTTRI